MQSDRRPRRANCRRGLSLIEVIIAMGILVGTTAVLVQLIRIGERQANRAVDMTDAQTLCHNKMAELLAGLGPFSAVESEPLGVDSPWDYSVKIEPVGFRQLYAITVIVTEHVAEPQTVSGEEASNPRSFHLTRWVNASELPPDFQFEFDDTASTTDSIQPSDSIRDRYLGQQ